MFSGWSEQDSKDDAEGNPGSTNNVAGYPGVTDRGQRRRFHLRYLLRDLGQSVGQSVGQ